MCCRSIEDLIRQYQEGITKLYLRRQELQRQFPSARGKESAQMLRRIDLLQEEQFEMTLSLRDLIRGRRKHDG